MGCLLVAQFCGLENFESDSCFSMIEVKSSVFGFGELLCCTCFCCECPTVIFSHSQELAATNWLEGISVESLGVWEGDFCDSDHFRRNFGLALIQTPSCFLSRSFRSHYGRGTNCVSSKIAPSPLKKSPNTLTKISKLDLCITMMHAALEKISLFL